MFRRDEPVAQASRTASRSCHTRARLGREVKSARDTNGQGINVETPYAAGILELFGEASVVEIGSHSGL